MAWRPDSVSAPQSGVRSSARGCPAVEVTGGEPLLQADVYPLMQRLLDDTEDRLLLVGRRHLRSNNSWMHNIEVLVKGKPRCTLQIHPDDAARRGIVDGEHVRDAGTELELLAPGPVVGASLGVVRSPQALGSAGGWGPPSAASHLTRAQQRSRSAPAEDLGMPVGDRWRPCLAGWT